MCDGVLNLSPWEHECERVSGVTVQCLLEYKMLFVAMLDQCQYLCEGALSIIKNYLLINNLGVAPCFSWVEFQLFLSFF